MKESLIVLRDEKEMKLGVFPSYFVAQMTEKYSLWLQICFLGPCTETE